MEPVILGSARRHGVADEDMLHAVGAVMAVDFEAVLIVHAMVARTRYLR